tara:strand:+ start:1025 stop:1600 length:576 start_codon:yes stop_codon:yes gene_type:complete
MAIPRNKTKNSTLVSVRNKSFLQTIFKVFNESKNTYIIVPNLCNNSGTFSGPINTILKDHLSSAYLNYQLLSKKFLAENKGYCQIVECLNNKKNNNKIFVANMIAQDTYRPVDNKRTINYLYLMKSMYNIGLFIDRTLDQQDNDVIVQIHSPKFGMGYPGGKWEFIKDLVEDIWRNKNVFVYNNLQDAPEK